jgi:glycosyltransferase involved in cell wall biosynthesis
MVLRRWVDNVVFVADAMRQSYVESLPDLESRFTTIYKGLPPLSRRVPSQEARRALRLPYDVSLLGSVGRLVSQKRFDRLLEAMVFLRDDVHLVVAGEGPLRGALGLRAQDLGLRNRVHFLGYQRDIATVMDAIDLLVITSDREGMSGVMLEALSRRVPVVSTDVSGAKEGLEPTADGSVPGLITGFAPPEIASALNSILYDKTVRDEMGLAAERRYLDRFSFEGMLDAWEVVLRKA